MVLTMQWKVIPGVVASVACTALLSCQLADATKNARAGSAGAGTRSGKQVAGACGAVTLLSGGTTLKTAPGQLIATASRLQSLLRWKAACVGASVRNSQQCLRRCPFTL